MLAAVLRQTAATSQSKPPDGSCDCDGGESSSPFGWGISLMDWSLMALGLQIGSREHQPPADTVNQQVYAWGWGGRSKRGEETNKQLWNGSVGA